MEPLVLHTAGRPGWIEVICGSMFSGKTEELIRRLKRAKIARQHVEIFKPSVEVRYSEESVVSHDENAILSTPVDTASQIMLLVGRADVVGIDEGQFFDPDLIDVCQKLASSGKRVIVAGLDQDYLGRPFEPIPQLMAVAEHVTKLHAVCMVCGAPANHSQRITPSDKRVMIGAASAYEPRCRFCFDPASSASGAGYGQADAHATTNTGKSSAAAEPDALAADGKVSDRAAGDGQASDGQASDGAPAHGSAEGPDGRVPSVTRTDD